MKLKKKDIIEFAVFVFIVLAATFVKQKISNTDKVTQFDAPSESRPQFETYLFIDRVGVLHTASDCKGIKPPNKSEVLKIQDLQKSHLQKICSRCITEEQLEVLIKKVDP